MLSLVSAMAKRVESLESRLDAGSERMLQVVQNSNAQMAELFAAQNARVADDLAMERTESRRLREQLLLLTQEVAELRAAGKHTRIV